MPSRDELRTNRDLYLFVARLGQDVATRDRALADYLTMLWQLGTAHLALDELPLATFAELLERARHGAPLQSDRVASRGHRRVDPLLAGYERWEHTILEQIVDLHEMQRAGTLAHELRYFGLDSPRGSRWYNFDPCGFLECAVAGTFGGWDSEDPTGRDLVPGQVVVLDETGRLASVDPGDLDESIVEIPTVSWDRFADFLWAGQSYE